MKVALAIWNGRISPVFDVSRQIIILDIEDGRVEKKYMEPLDTDIPFHKVARLMDLKVDTLICGAVSRGLADILATHGIKAISFIAGNVNEVIAAFLNGGLPNPEMAMPGCRNNGKRGRRCGEGAQHRHQAKRR